MTKEIIQTIGANEDAEVELYLEEGIYYLLIKSLIEGDEEKEPMPAGEDLETAEGILRFAAGIGLFSNADKLEKLINSKILREVHGLPGVTVMSIDKLLED